MSAGRAAWGVGALLCLAGAGALEPAARAADFWSVWGDGKAELSGYRLMQPRYGQSRVGTAVLIYVTEDLHEGTRVKDEGKGAKDSYPVLKLNAVRKFRTGIYDYSVMTSVFSRVQGAAGERAWPLRKVSFSSQEWCGHVYHQLVPRGEALRSESHSYFDGEADEVRDLPRPADGVVEDELPVLLRSYAGRGDYLQAGKGLRVPYLGSLLRARLLHQPLSWGRAALSRAAAPVEVEVPAGRLRAIVYTVAVEGGETGTYWFEAAAPHRLLKWRWSGGEEGVMLGSARLPYWQLNGAGQESYLKQLGLSEK
jgi:hypothetical protein